MSSCMSGGIISRSSISRSKISPGMSMISSHIVSVTVEKICDCFLILFVGSEAISEAGRHLARARLCLGKVATLSEDLLLVNVVCVCHVDIIGTGSDGSRPLVCHLGNWSEAADQFVSLTSATQSYNQVQKLTNLMHN